MTDLTSYLDSALDYLIITYGGLGADKQMLFEKYIDMHANDYIHASDSYANLTPDEKDELIKLTVATYRSL
jgi:hypothetical protein